MYLTQLASGSLTQDTAIALSSTPTLVTNGNVKLNSTNNGFIIVNPGVYKVRLQMNASAGSSGTALGAQLYTNGEAVAMTAVNVTVANSASAEIVIEYPVEVIAAAADQQALVQFYALQAGTIVNGYVTVERVS